MNKTLTRVGAALGAAAVISLAGATSASAAWRASDPVVRVGQPCVKSYEKGIVNQSGYVLVRDTRYNCYYDKWQGPIYMGVHVVAKR